MADTRGAPPPEAGARSRKPGGLRSPVTWVIILGAAVAGGAFLLWRQRNSAGSAGSTTTTADTSTGDQTDLEGEIATLQTEIENLQSSAAQGGTGSGGGVTTGNPITSPSANPPPAGSNTPPAAKPKVPGMPTAVKGSAASAGSIRLNWPKVAGATSYQVRVTYQGKLAGSATTSGTTATVGGLGANHTYTAHVKACNAAGCSAETNGPVVKTPR